jgi:hypothetical protein
MFILMFGCSDRRTIDFTQPPLMSTVTIQLTTNNHGSINGANVRLVNNANSDLVWQRTVSNNNRNIVFSDVIRGIYTLTVTHAWYQNFTFNNFSINWKGIGILEQISRPCNLCYY